MVESGPASPVVGHLSFSGDFGGREKVAASLFNSMSEISSPCFLYIILEERHGSKRNQNLLNCLEKIDVSPRLLKTGSRFDFNLFRKFAKILRQDGVKVLHCHCYKSLFYVLLMRSLGMIDGIVVYTLHGLVLKDGFFSSVIKTVQDVGLRMCDGVVGCSREILDSNGDGVREERSSVIINAIDNPYPDFDSISARKKSARDELVKRWSLNPEKSIIINVGRLCPQKNFSLYLQLIESISASGNDSDLPVFLLIGNGEMEEELHAEAHERGVADKVFFTGFVSDMETVYLGADLLVQTSFWEGTPMCLLEARSYGLPVVAPAVGGNVDVVNDGIDGFMFPNGDLSGLKDKTLAYIEDSNIRMHHGRLALEDVRERFNTRDWARKHLDFYARLEALSSV